MAPRFQQTYKDRFAHKSILSPLQGWLPGCIETHGSRRGLRLYRSLRELIQLGILWWLNFSAAAILGSVANWVLFLNDCIVLPLMIRAEEHKLLSRYGAEFPHYMRRVPRFFPKWTW